MTKEVARALSGTFMPAAPRVSPRPADHRDFPASDTALHGNGQQAAIEPHIFDAGSDEKARTLGQPKHGHDLRTSNVKVARMKRLEEVWIRTHSSPAQTNHPDVSPRRCRRPFRGKAQLATLSATATMTSSGVSIKATS